MDAFVACGGCPDKSGCVERVTLVRIIKQDFGLTIDIEELIDAVDTDGSGEIEYSEFKVRAAEGRGGGGVQSSATPAHPHARRLHAPPQELLTSSKSS